MKSENGLGLELPEVYKAIDLSEVLVISLPHLTNRLLFDVRVRDGQGPLIRLAPPVRSPEERFAYLRRLRPSFSDPEKYVFIQWPLGIQSLVADRVWQRITEHCEAAGGPEARRRCDDLMQRLHELDRHEDVEAIRGQNYRTLWPRPRS